MIERIRKNFTEGKAGVRWLAQFLAERSRAETSLFKLRYESSKLGSRVDELYKEVGKRILDLKEKEENDVFKDFIVLQTMDEIKVLRKEMQDFREKEAEVNKVSE